MMDDVFDSVLIGRIDSKSYQPPREGYKEGTTWVRIAGAAVTMRAPGDTAARLPVDGSVAAFRVRGSRNGQIPLIVAWGWVNELSNLYNGAPQISIDWVGDLVRSGTPVTGGVVPPGVGQPANGNGHK